MRKSFDADPKNTKDPEREPVILGPVVGLIDGTWRIQERNILRQIATEEVFLADRTLPNINWNERPKRQMSPCVLQELMKAGFFGVPGSAQVVALQNILRPCCSESRYTGCGWSGGFINILLRNEPWFIDILRAFMGAPLNLEEARLDGIGKNRMKFAVNPQRSTGTINKFVFYRNNFNNCSMATDVLTFILRQSDDQLAYIGITSIPGTSTTKRRSTRSALKKTGRTTSEKANPTTDVASDPASETNPKASRYNRPVCPSLDHLPFFAHGKDHGTDYRLVALSADVLWKHMRPEWQDCYLPLWAEQREENNRRQAAQTTDPGASEVTDCNASGVENRNASGVVDPNTSVDMVTSLCSGGTPTPGHAVNTRFSMYCPREVQVYFDTQAKELRSTFGIGGVETPVHPGNYISEYARVANFAQGFTRLVHAMDVRLNMTPEILHTRAAAHRIALVSRLVPGMLTNARVNSDGTGEPVAYFMSNAMSNLHYKRRLEVNSAGISDANFIEEDNAIGTPVARRMGEMFYAILSPGMDSAKPKKTRTTAAAARTVKPATTATKAAAIKARKAAAKGAARKSTADTEGNEMQVDSSTEDNAPAIGSYLMPEPEPELDAKKTGKVALPPCCAHRSARRNRAVPPSYHFGLGALRGRDMMEALLGRHLPDPIVYNPPNQEQNTGHFFEVMEETVDSVSGAVGGVEVTSPSTATSVKVTNPSTSASLNASSPPSLPLVTRFDRHAAPSPPSSPPPVFSPVTSDCADGVPDIGMIEIEVYYADMLYNDAGHPSPPSEASSERRGTRPARRSRKSTPQPKVYPTRAAVRAAAGQASDQHKVPVTCRYCFLTPLGDETSKEDSASLTSRIISGALSGTQERLDELRVRLDILEDQNYVVPEGHENCAALAAAIRGLDLSLSSLQLSDSNVGGENSENVSYMSNVSSVHSEDVSAAVVSSQSTGATVLSSDNVNSTLAVQSEPVDAVQAVRAASPPPLEIYLDPRYHPVYTPSATSSPSATSVFSGSEHSTISPLSSPPSSPPPQGPFFVPRIIFAFPPTIGVIPVPLLQHVPPMTPLQSFSFSPDDFDTPEEKAPDMSTTEGESSSPAKPRKRTPAKPRKRTPAKPRKRTPAKPRKRTSKKIETPPFSPLTSTAPHISLTSPLTFLPLDTAMSNGSGHAEGQVPVEHTTDDDPESVGLVSPGRQPDHTPAFLRRRRSSYGSISMSRSVSPMRSVSPTHSTIALPNIAHHIALPDVEDLMTAPAVPSTDLITTNVGLTEHELAQAQHEAFFVELERAQIAPDNAMDNGEVYSALGFRLESIDRALQELARSETYGRAGASSLFQNIAAPTQLSECSSFRASTPSAPENTHSTLLMYTNGPDDALNDLYGASSPFITPRDDLFSSRSNSPAHDSGQGVDGTVTSSPHQSGATPSDSRTPSTSNWSARNIYTDSLAGSPSPIDIYSPLSFDSEMSFFDETPTAETDRDLVEGR